MQQIILPSSMSPPPPRNISDFSDTKERRRTIRIRRSALLDAKMDLLDRPSIKIAETLDEYCQAFKVLHDVYLNSGYLPRATQSGMHYNHHHLLPKTCVFIFKTYLEVISTMSYIPDTPMFGVPMDDLYRDKVDELRNAGRKIVEIGSLATIRHKCWHNIMTFLSKAVFMYATHTKADDLCIMVNPKHVRFYESIFLFELLGEERHYAKVDAPAVALRVNMRNIEPDLRNAYANCDFDTDLHNFFVKVNSPAINNVIDKRNPEKDRPLDYATAKHLLAAHPELLWNLPSEHRAILEKTYYEALHTEQRLPA